MMTQAEFITTAKLRGLATAETAKQYAQGRNDLTEADLEEVYRKQTTTDRAHEPSKWRNYQGARCTKRLKEPESHREY